MSAVANGVGKVVEGVDDEDLFSSLILKDFSPQVYSVQTKFYSVSLLSLFVCIFDLSSETAFLGVKIEDLNERLIEIGTAGVALLLFILLMLRVWEERDAFLQLDKYLSRIGRASEIELERIQTIQNNAIHQIRSSQLLDGSLIRQAEVALNNSQAAMSKMEQKLSMISAPEFVSKTVGETKMTLTLVTQQVAQATADAVQRLNNNLQSTNEAVSRLELNGNAFIKSQGIIIGKKGLGYRRKTRIILFDYLLPLLTMGFVMLAFFLPNQAKSLASILKV